MERCPQFSGWTRGVPLYVGSMALQKWRGDLQLILVKSDLLAHTQFAYIPPECEYSIVNWQGCSSYKQTYILRIVTCSGFD